MEYIERGEKACSEFDSELMAAGSDAESAMEIQRKKDEVLAKLAQFEVEWEKLEEEEEELKSWLN